MPKDERNKIIIQELKRLIRKPVIYRNGNISRDILAQKLGVTSKKLSLIVHEYDQKSLLNMINEQRIKHFKRLLDSKDGKEQTLEEIALISGFNNRLTMFRYFVKYYGVTPSDYKKSKD